MNGLRGLAWNSADWRAAAWLAWDDVYRAWGSVELRGAARPMCVGQRRLVCWPTQIPLLTGVLANTDTAVDLANGDTAVDSIVVWLAGALFGSPGCYLARD